MQALATSLAIIMATLGHQADAASMTQATTITAPLRPLHQGEGQSPSKARLPDKQITKKTIAASIASYLGNCPCLPIQPGPSRPTMRKKKCPDAARDSEEGGTRCRIRSLCLPWHSPFGLL